MPAVPGALNQGVLDNNGNVIATDSNIYVDDILSAGVSNDYVKKLLAAIIEAIFTVCGEPQIDIRQCPLSLEKWLEMVIGPTQTVFGLYVNTNKMMIGITQEYRQQVKSMLNDNWTSKRRFFQAADMQKLIGKIARLGEGAPWIFNSHCKTTRLFSRPRHISSDLSFCRFSRGILLAIKPTLQRKSVSHSNWQRSSSTTTSTCTA